MSSIEMQSVAHRVSLQLWTVRHALASNPDATLGAIADAGYCAVELAPLPDVNSARELARQLRRHRLQTASIHCDLLTRSNLPSIRTLVETFECCRIIWHGWPRDTRFDSLAGVEELLGEYSAAARIAAEQQFEFGLHTHWWEFEPVEGQPPYQLYLQSLPTTVFLQLDVYWAQVAGMNPLVLLDKLRPRLKSLHLKDGPAIHDQPMTALGCGCVDIAAIVQACDPQIDWVVELDECADDPLQAAALSWQYLQAQATQCVASSAVKALGPLPSADPLNRDDT